MGHKKFPNQKKEVILFCPHTIFYFQFNKRKTKNRIVGVKF